MQRYIRMLRDGKLKVTPRREAILAYFLKEGKYATPEQVWEDLRLSLGRLGLPTVYRNLEELHGLGILVRVEGAENRFHYGLCRADDPHAHHHHIVCMECRRMQEVEGCLVEALSGRIEAETGFKLTGHTINLQGLCRSCAVGVADTGHPGDHR
ncbi:MAG: Fur family transcriptional regulator [bacterium]|nr:Fur family transcriptional regulator [bacterium]